MSKQLTSLLIGLVVVLLSAACSGNGGEGEPSSPSQEATAPPFAEAITEITLDNVSQIHYLGRLDQPGTPSTIFAHALSPDGIHLAGLTNDLFIEWNLVSGRRVFTTLRDRAQYVYYTPDKDHLFTIDDRGNLHLYTAALGEEVAAFPAHIRFNGAIAYAPDVGLLAIGGEGGMVRVWDVLAQEKLAEFSAFAVAIETMALTADGELLAVATRDGFVRLWDWRTETQLAELDHEGARPDKMTFSPDASQLAVGTDTYVALWSVPDGELQVALPTGNGGVSEVMKYSPDGRYLLTGGIPESILLWDTSEYRMAGALPNTGGDRLGAAFSPDGNLLLTTLWGGATVLWDLTTLTEQTVNRAALDTPSRQIINVDWTADGFSLILIDASGPVYVWGIGEVFEPEP